MKRVSFEVAKALKKAGFPQDYENAKDTYTNLNGGIWVKPTYLDVWTWLWREKKIFIETSIHFDPVKGYYITAFIYSDDLSRYMEAKKDPEEAIIAAIEYLVQNKLLK